MFKRTEGAGSSNAQNNWHSTHDRDPVPESNAHLNGNLDRSSVPESRLRTIAKVLFVPVKIVAICVTVPVCATLECLSGISIGIILGSAFIMKAYDSHGLLLAMPVAIVVFPLSLVMGAGCALVGFFFGIYDGFHLGWYGKKEPLEQTALNVKGRIDSFLNHSQRPVVTHTVRTERIARTPNLQDDSNFLADSVKTDAGKTLETKEQTVISANATTAAVSSKIPTYSEPIASPPTATSKSDSATNETKQSTVTGSNPFGDDEEF